MRDEFPLLFDHGGDLEKAAQFAGCLPEDLLDFSNLLNPSGTPPGLAEVLKPKLTEAFRHPSSGEALRSKIASKMKIPMEQILLGAGTTEFIRFLPWVKKPERPVILGPTYGDYAPALHMVECEPQWILASEEEKWVFPRVGWEKTLESKPDWVIFARPNNPLGQNWPFDDLFQTMEKHPEIFFVADETCVEISDNPEDSFLTRPLPSNLAVLRSFSKAYAVPGLRLGYTVVPARFAGLWKRVQIPWTVSPLALEAGLYLLDQEKWLLETHEKNQREKKRVYSQLCELKHFKTYASSITAFTLKGLSLKFSSLSLLKRFLKEEKILLRSLAQHPGLGDDFFRVGLRTPKENDRLIAALQRWKD